MNPALAPVRNVVPSISAMQSPGWWAERNQTRIAEACPSPPLAGEREGPAPKAWEGEVVLGNSGATAPPPSPYPLPRKRVERESFINMRSVGPDCHPPTLTPEHLPHCRADRG